MRWKSRYPVILASSSPRRQQLLKTLDIPFQVVIKEVSELSYHPEGPDALVVENARLKGRAVQQDCPDCLVIASDTIVWFENRPVLKPRDENEARVMLKMLSGRTHTVYTGVYLGSPEEEETFVATTRVTFVSLSDDEIEYYVRKYRPLDKAGAYGAQDWIGLVAVRHLDGDFYTVMGLPTAQLWQRLQKYLVLEWDESASFQADRPA